MNNEVMIDPLPAEFIFIEMFKALDHSSVGQVTHDMVKLVI